MMMLVPEKLNEKGCEFLLRKVLHAVNSHEPEIIFDLTRTQFICPYGAVTFLVLLESLFNHRINSTIRYAETDTAKYLERIDFFEYAHNYAQFTPPDRVFSGFYFRNIDSMHVLEITSISKDTNIVSKLLEIIRNALALTTEEAARFVSPISELCQNVQYHAQTEGYLCVQRYTKKEEVQIAVADGGIGINSSLRQKYAEEHGPWNDATAIRLALQPNVSSLDTFYPGHQRGIGLSTISELANRQNGTLRLRSGSAMAVVKNRTSLEHNLPPLPGVQVALRLFRRI